MIVTFDQAARKRSLLAHQPPTRHQPRLRLVDRGGKTMTIEARSVYRHAELDPILNPNRVAIVGISPSERSAGARTLGQLRLLGFKGRIDLINGKYSEVQGIECHRSVSSLNDPPDVVIVTVPQAAVEDVLLDAATAGARAAIVFAAGYADVGTEESRRKQERLSSIALDSGMKLIGPNCLGAVNYVAGAALTYTNTPLLRGADETILRPQGRAVGLVSQSGGLGFAAAQAVQRGVSISHILTSGNSCDVDVADYVAYLAEEPTCSAIACVFEAIPEPRRLIQAAEIALRAGKPLVIHKLGVSDEGAAAAMTHSGLLAGAHDAFRATLSQAGAILVEEFDALIETAAYCAKADPSAVEGVIVLTSSGGASVMAADKAELHRVSLPQPGSELQAALSGKLPSFATARNPCDVTGGLANDLQGYFACVDDLLADPQYGMMVTAHPYSVHTANRIRLFGDAAARHGKLIANVWITEYLAGPGLVEAERDERLTVFRSMERCFDSVSAFAKWTRYRQRALAQAPSHRLSPIDAPAQSAVRLDRHVNGILTEREAKSALACYGIPVVREALATSEDEAVTAAEAIASAVVLKVDSPDIPHKTEVGAVAIGLNGEAAVRDAYRKLLENVGRNAPGARVDGLLVQEMVASGLELVIGGKSDPLFGPMIIVGVGGTLVELLRDRAMATVPVTRFKAMAMLESLSCWPLLNGYRGSAAVNLPRLCDVIVQVSEFLSDHREKVEELDVNPVICSAADVTAVDALIRVRR